MTPLHQSLLGRPPRRRRTSLTLFKVVAAATLLGGLAALACGASVSTAPAPRFTDVPTATLAPDPSPVPRTPDPTALPFQPGPTLPPIYTFTIVSAEYGYIELSAPPGSTCSATVSLPGDEVLELAAQQVGTSGRIYWKYPQTPRDGGSGHAQARCTLTGGSDTESQDFEVKA